MGKGRHFWEGELGGGERLKGGRREELLGGRGERLKGGRAEGEERN